MAVVATALEVDDLDDISLIVERQDVGCFTLHLTVGDVEGIGDVRDIIGNQINVSQNLPKLVFRKALGQRLKVHCGHPSLLVWLLCRAPEHTIYWYLCQ